ncbi:hypothetical protein Bbelb_329180 [Branchiostoma belcheri]|nr:hypothetical protein Bbelb_329180 [Branchiostoma belcheri]
MSEWTLVVDLPSPITLTAPDVKITWPGGSWVQPANQRGEAGVMTVSDQVAPPCPHDGSCRSMSRCRLTGFFVPSLNTLSDRPCVRKEEHEYAGFSFEPTRLTEPRSKSPRLTKLPAKYTAEYNPIDEPRVCGELKTNISHTTHASA